jgi:hypothetical protein
MKNTILTAAMLLVSVGVFAQSSSLKHRKTAVPDVKTLVVNQNQIELGENMELKSSEFDLTVSNAGDKPITVKRIATTAFIRPKNEAGFSLAPGESKTVRMVHEPAETGQFLETAVIESDASNIMEIVKVFGTIADKYASRK